jgi:hypothetical protein
MTTLTTTFGKVRTGSTRRFVAVVKRGPDEPQIHARSDKRATLETRLRREGFLPEVATGLFVRREPGRFVGAVDTLAVVQIVDALDS